MKLYIISSGKYGSRIVNSLAEMGLASSMVGLEEIPDDLPEFIDDFSSYLPKSIPQADLILAVGLFGDINMVVPLIAKESGAKSVIIPIHDPTQVPPGLQREIEESAPDVKIVFPKPFCTLEPVGDEFIDEFASQFGKPEIEIEADGLIKKIKVIRTAPCGSTRYIAEHIEGIPVEEAELESGNKLHNYPCNASMTTDPVVGDTILHLAGYQTKEAVKRGLGFAMRSAVVDHETCEASECEHECIKHCPQVQIGVDTVQLNENEQAFIDPASCGACEICINECPYGSIELEERKFPLE
jgi:NAD-dependent dihydropyrimidine dehydrogenase PreA subunit